MHTKKRSSADKLNVLKEGIIKTGRFSWSPNGKKLAVPTNGELHVYIYDSIDNTPPKLNESPIVFRKGDPDDMSITLVEWINDTTLLFNNNEDIVIYDIKNGNSKSNTFHGSELTTIDYSHKIKLLAVGYDDGSFSVFDLEDTNDVAQLVHFRQDSDMISCVKWTIQGEKLFVATRESKVYIYDFSDLRNNGLNKIPTFEEFKHQHKSWISSIISTRVKNKELLITTSWDRTIQCYDLNSNELLWTNDDINDPVSRIDLYLDHDSSKGYLAVKTHETLQLFEHDFRQDIRQDKFAPNKLLYFIDSKSNSIFSHLTYQSREKSLLVSLEHDSKLSLLRLKDIIGKENKPKKGLNYKTAKVILIGDQSVGKTGIFNRLLRDKFEATLPTHSRSIGLLDIGEIGENKKENERCKIYLWDFAGHAGLRLLNQSYLKEADIVIIVYDWNKLYDAQYQGVDYWTFALEQELSKSRNQSKKVKKFLVAARSDIACGTNLDPEEIKNNQDFDELFETSAITNEGIDKLKEAIQTAINWKEIPSRYITNQFSDVEKLVEKLLSNPIGKVLWGISELSLLSSKEAVFDNLPYEDLSGGMRQLGNEGVIHPLEFGNYYLLMPEILDVWAVEILNKAGKSPDNEVQIEDFEDEEMLNKINKITNRTLTERDLQCIGISKMYDLMKQNLVLLNDEDTRKISFIFPNRISNRLDIKNLKKLEIFIDYTVHGAVDAIYANLVVMLKQSRSFGKVTLYNNCIVLKKGAYKCVLYKQNQGDDSGGLLLFLVKDEISEKLEPETIHLKSKFFGLVEAYLETLFYNQDQQFFIRHQYLSCIKCDYEQNIDFLKRVPGAKIEDEPNRLEPIICPKCGTKYSKLDVFSKNYLDKNQYYTDEINAISEELHRKKERLKSVGKQLLEDFDIIFFTNVISLSLKDVLKDLYNRAISTVAWSWRKIETGYHSLDKFFQELGHPVIVIFDLDSKLDREENLKFLKKLINNLKIEKKEDLRLFFTNISIVELQKLIDSTDLTDSELEKINSFDIVESVADIVNRLEIKGWVLKDRFRNLIKKEHISEMSGRQDDFSVQFDKYCNEALPDYLVNAIDVLDDHFNEDLTKSKSNLFKLIKRCFEHNIDHLIYYYDKLSLITESYLKIKGYKNLLEYIIKRMFFNSKSSSGDKADLKYEKNVYKLIKHLLEEDVIKWEDLFDLADRKQKSDCYYPEFMSLLIDNFTREEISSLCEWLSTTKHRSRDFRIMRLLALKNNKNELKSKMFDILREAGIIKWKNWFNSFPISDKGAEGIDKEELRKKILSLPREENGWPFMRVRKLRIKNIQCIEELTISFYPHKGTKVNPSILISKNALGKTTILKCLALGLMGKENAESLIKELGSGGSLVRQNADGQILGHGEIELLIDYSVDSEANESEWETLWSGLRVTKSNELESLSDSDLTLDDSDISPRNAWEKISFLRNLDNYSFGLIYAYGSHRSITIEAERNEPENEKMRTLDGVDSLFKQMKVLVDPLLTRKVIEGNRPNRLPDLLLNKYHEMLIAILPDILIETADTSSNGSPKYTIRQKYNGCVPLHQYSDGLKGVIAFLTHFFLALVQFSESSGKTLQINEPYGILLIDEIGIHLHPTWQTNIFKQINIFFPGFQLIGTTHSPLVIGGAKRGSINMKLLERNSQNRIIIKEDCLESRSTIEKILEDYFSFDILELLGSETSVNLKDYLRLLGQSKVDPKLQILEKNLFAGMYKNSDLGESTKNDAIELFKNQALSILNNFIERRVEVFANKTLKEKKMPKAMKETISNYLLLLTKKRISLGLGKIKEVIKKEFEDKNEDFEAFQKEAIKYFTNIDPFSDVNTEQSEAVSQKLQFIKMVRLIEDHLKVLNDVTSDSALKELNRNLQTDFKSSGSPNLSNLLLEITTNTTKYTILSLRDNYESILDQLKKLHNGTVATNGPRNQNSNKNKVLIDRFTSSSNTLQLLYNQMDVFDWFVQSQSSPKKQSIDLIVFFKKFGSIWNPILKKKQCQLVCHIKGTKIENLKEWESIILAGCLGNWFIVLSALCKNAFDHAFTEEIDGVSDRKRQIVFDIIQDDSDEGLKLLVKDNGKGIDEENRSYIYNILSTGTLRHGHSKRGIITVKKLLEEEASDIELERENKNGTCFIIKIPKKNISYPVNKTIG